MLSYKNFNSKEVTKGHVFTFTFLETKKYNKYEVATRKSKKFFGKIKWFFLWQEYGFFPEDNINVLSVDMLYDIYSFINYLEYDLKENKRAKDIEKKHESLENKTPEEMAQLIKEKEDELLKEGKRLFKLFPNIQYKKDVNCYLILALEIYYIRETGIRFGFRLGKATTGFQGWLMSKKLHYLNEWMEDNIKG